MTLDKIWQKIVYKPLAVKTSQYVGCGAARESHHKQLDIKAAANYLQIKEVMKLTAGLVEDFSGHPCPAVAMV